MRRTLTRTLLTLLFAAVCVLVVLQRMPLEDLPSRYGPRLQSYKLRPEDSYDLSYDMLPLDQHYSFHEADSFPELSFRRTNRKPLHDPRHPHRQAKHRKHQPLTEADRLRMYRGSPCHNLSFAHPTLPVTALVSFPGSGNTWLRHLIQQATGVAVGAVYPEPEVLKIFPGGGIADGRVVVIKTHRIDLGIKNLSRVIILIRNPFYSLISYYNWLKKHKRFHSENEKVWNLYINNQTNIWFRKYNTWLQLNQPKLVVWYEDLEKDTRKEMRRVINFLNVPVPDNRFECMIRNSEGYFHRYPTTKSLYPFPDNVTNIALHYIHRIDELIKAQQN